MASGAGSANGPADASGAPADSPSSLAVPRKRKFLLAAMKETSGGTVEKVRPHRPALAEARSKATSSYIDADIVQNSSGSAVMLNDYASQMLRKVSQHIRAQLRKDLHLWPKPFITGSACSGTDVWHTVISTVIANLCDDGMAHVPVECAFVCEKVPVKQRFLMELSHVSSNASCCCFCDVNELASGSATCARHPASAGEDSTKCAVPMQLHGYACGFSCCPYSKLNARSSSNRGAVSQREKSQQQPPGKDDGIDTAIGNAQYIITARPMFSFMENVAELQAAVASDVPRKVCWKHQSLCFGTGMIQSCLQ